MHAIIQVPGTAHCIQASGRGRLERVERVSGKQRAHMCQQASYRK